jgi:hypothetical protein
VGQDSAAARELPFLFREPRPDMPLTRRAEK